MRTNYKDYIPSTSQKQYQMTDNPNGTVSLTDVTEYTQEGDKFSAGILNELSQNANWPLTHSKSGTTHALTGLSGVSGTVSCVFKATAAFNAGDTIRVDNTGYTIQLSNGEAPEANLFVSGASVPVVIDTEGKKVNFKAAGVSLPDGTTAIYKVYTENGTFTAPITGKYRFTAIGQGGVGSGDGELSPTQGYRQSAGGASGGVAQITLSLQRGASYSVTVDAAQTSLGSLITATAGAQGNWGSSGVGGTATGGDVNFPGMSGNVNDPKGQAHGGAHDNAVDTIPFLATQADNQNSATYPSSSSNPHEGLSISSNYVKLITPYGCGGGGGCSRGSTGTYVEGGNGVTGALIVEMAIS